MRGIIKHDAQTKANAYVFHHLYRIYGCPDCLCLSLQHPQPEHDSDRRPGSFNGHRRHGAGDHLRRADAGVFILLFSTDHSFFQFTEINLHKIIVISLGVVINYFSVAILKRNRDRAGSQLKMTNEELMNTNSQLAQTNEELKKVNELLKAMASKDSLTNLRNRYALRQDFELYVGIPLYIAFLDLDEFKKTNDTKGHAFGDKILATVGKALADGFRTCNCYRYGGDEFLIVGENVTEEEFNHPMSRRKRRWMPLKLGFPADMCMACRRQFLNCAA